MKKLEEIVNKDSSWFYVNGGYEAVASTIGNVLKYEYLGSYQGDVLFLLEKDGQFGFLAYGYGSCSVCDMLEGCSNMKDLKELQDDMSQQIIWKDSKEDLLEFINKKDWEGTHFYYSNEWDSTLADFKGILK